MSINNIMLIGFMGTGKSTIARRLAETLGWTLVDTDQWIEAAEGMSIAQLFKQKGESYFRSAEVAAIHDILQRSKQVIASGGGAVLNAKNREAMLKHALVIGLRADERTIIQRVSRDQSRPLLKDNVRHNVVKLLEERKHAYDFAHVQIDTSRSTIDETVAQILAYGKLSSKHKGRE